MLLLTVGGGVGEAQLLEQPCPQPVTRQHDDEGVDGHRVGGDVAF